MTDYSSAGESLRRCSWLDFPCSGKGGGSSGGLGLRSNFLGVFLDSACTFYVVIIQATVAPMGYMIPTLPELVLE